MRPIILEGNLVSLGILLREDLKHIWLWYNDRDVRHYLSFPEEIFFYEDELEWYEALRREKKHEKVFAVIENSSRSLVGLVGLHKIDFHNGRAELGYFIGKEYWGRGYASEAVSLAVRYAFEWLNLRKVYAHVYESNGASIRILEKNGFKLAGRWRKHQYVPGEGFVDVLCYELFREP
ncbi:N-acetyltransferase [Thermococcus onnurineus NA1]|uniref:N-acetyltransferase n=1 Tax=Thermococcus onnurineus (strain NA1) TaxID=523850 RepID=B6YVA8_THEON|nr:MULTISPECIES: GNAT family protein [Thermococcus]ACJ16186.1 N-acetyltransferase [Thermococcus onnurineus NA1]NJE47285.1 N-acetyltransferase [Thermococcus sp. GR7]NJE78650.1 N-acetyltransferase [Thermococcus sp. GR4]NJF23225.1 N-acetyltransferase [Thermococcus sp. GR5]